ncbi:hypothetical protein AGABI2DRAFT_207587 [Agaricus bisporus var. bisporus H97]|uniref:hypothetical protein n=1 Tax=Agaricus bisporus var. bisporus (strain H97 / ATCC MYA-4626 / FGSC 10389) TaxID=936046 RepID=UPI00029F4FB4|nr:hypothetical protein AGABI2DRAFT_207587 [Agaricus bisporus var. bisporus H97]EKV46113.1 hypothetical protein AGABI2DRAFT_207587 [Agaricus bisporus var. bisporus H97]
MLSLTARILILGLLAQCNGQVEAQKSKGSTVTSEDWENLNQTVAGRLFQGNPFAEPCFSGQFDSPECKAIQDGYLDEKTRTDNPGAYIETQWSTCQATGEQCLLDSLNPHDPLPTLPPQECKRGSVPDYFINVQEANDVKAAFAFVKEHDIPLVVKNTGHDYKGRSSAPGSLGLWTYNLKDMKYTPDFVPTGCSTKPQQGFTAGAGVQWGEAYAFADSNNITVTVGVTGGWLQGGGHGALSPSLGLGVDRVLEIKVVTPDGELKIANECQNEDLFWALRGGGGGTYGVVLDHTILASPRVTLPTLILSFAPDTTLAREMWSIMSDNALKWAEEGWGGFSRSNVMILLNPKLSQTEAQASLAPLLDFGKQLQATNPDTTTLIFTEFSSWNEFFQTFTSQFVVGANLALASRLIPKDLFQTAETKEDFVSALLAADAATPGLIILIAAPTAFPFVPGSTSVTEAWRSSLYHITLRSNWNWNATLTEKKSHYDAASQSIDNLRKITPDAAYQNEADVHEPNHEVSFWGDNYSRLLQIKEKYDPDHLLDCWHCVGWRQESPRFSCYV